MKKWICAALAAALGLSLCACGSSEVTTPTEQLQVGYAREKSMPDMGLSAPLHGYGNNALRIAQGVLDYLYITCVAFTSGDQTILLMSQDLAAITFAQTEKIRDGIQAQTGIPKNQIANHATANGGGQTEDTDTEDVHVFPQAGHSAGSGKGQGANYF